MTPYGGYMTANGPGEVAPGREDRTCDFFARHGGPGTLAKRSAESQGGLQGWSEVFAADGYRLRCDWSKLGSHEEMQYLEIPP